MANILIPTHSVPYPMFEAADRLGIDAIEVDSNIAFRGKHSSLVVLLATEYQPDYDIGLADAVAEIQLEDENL